VRQSEEEKTAAVRSHRLVKTDAIPLYINGTIVKAFQCKVCDVVILRHGQEWLSEVPDKITMKEPHPIASCSEVRMENALT